MDEVNNGDAAADQGDDAAQGNHGDDEAPLNRELEQQKLLQRRHYNALIRSFNELRLQDAVDALNIDELIMEQDRMETHFREAERIHFLMPVGEDDGEEYLAVQAFHVTSERSHKQIAK